MQRILTIDDDPSLRSFLRRGLTYEGFQVQVAASGDEGLKLIRQQAPNLVILDVMMPGMDGFQVLRELRASHPKLPVIMLTAKDEEGSQVQGLNEGADDYVVKPISLDVLLARIRAVLRRQGLQVSQVLKFQDLTMDLQSFSVKRGDRTVPLTNLEFKLLQEFMEQPERVMSKSYLLSRVWGNHSTADLNLVEVYIKQLRQKLEANGEQRLIHTIRHVGYVMRTV
ncbi:response regulator transcription factor [Deinococcus cellulosilyticus]|uniref:DNA-binding response regulator n=1 Tax=Deinococcus cellulosilyticus (strain DSM 18568 / NBRC 106333 / KACC 11606 / 5516J-15) TaxID=1223518 RepID=A0A511N4S5_DEIC1|nr:response regulator transcription factor [Deinococcus cellulosilyticus]GEM47467.1 DNA-binding response regulator [Deinococcus cellulosilyticus NBRC 106333 = KACC 11606]